MTATRLPASIATGRYRLRNRSPVNHMKKKLAFAGSFVVAFLATASVVLSSVAITLAEALEEKP